jgi:phosphoserine phosphatase
MDGEKAVGNWSSTMAHLEQHKLDCVYRLSDHRDGKSDESTGILSLHIDPTDLSLIKGNWAVLGRAEANGVSTAIVSSGPSLLAQRARRELGIDEIRANAIEIEDGRLTGRSDIQVPESGKGRVARAVMERLGVPPSRAASVGDGTADAAVGALVRLPVAYDSASSELDAVARVRLRHGELGRLADVLRI